MGCNVSSSQAKQSGNDLADHCDQAVAALVANRSVELPAKPRLSVVPEGMSFRDDNEHHVDDDDSSHDDTSSFDGDDGPLPDEDDDIFQFQLTEDAPAARPFRPTLSRPGESRAPRVTASDDSMLITSSSTLLSESSTMLSAHQPLASQSNLLSCNSTMENLHRELSFCRDDNCSQDAFLEVERENPTWWQEALEEAKRNAAATSPDPLE